jgi:type IV pilus assembly protein PilF
MMSSFMKNGVWMLSLALAALGSACGGKNASQVDEAILRYQVAQNLLAKGETTQGLSELIQAEALDPKNSEIQNLLGLAYLQNGRPIEGEEHLRKAVNLDPKFSDAQNHLCAVLISAEKYDEAIAHCSKAVENVVYATPERAYHNMGLAYVKKGDNVKAAESFKKALLHNRNFVLSHKSLGNLLQGQKKYQEALSHFEEASGACKASPKGAWGEECSEVYYQLAVTYVKLKNRPKAVAAFKTCVEEDDKSGYAQKCRDNLKILD